MADSFKNTQLTAMKALVIRVKRINGDEVESLIASYHIFPITVLDKIKLFIQKRKFLLSSEYEVGIEDVPFMDLETLDEVILESENDFEETICNITEISQNLELG